MTDTDLVVLFDVDNTLFDNDALRGDLADRLLRDFGASRADEYWAHYEALRNELGYADYLGALQRFRRGGETDAGMLELSTFLLDYPFASRVYPGAFELLDECRAIARTVILSDGDAVYQPWKIRRSGLGHAVDDAVLIYVHKEQQLDAVARQYPSAHYIAVDDKVNILGAIKAAWRDRVTTVFPRQGHYAMDRRLLAESPAPDVTVERIGDLLGRFDRLRGAI